MIGADTNILVRFLVRDEPNQAEKVRTLLKNGEVLFVNQVVLSELYWVLVKVYGYSKFDFIIAVDALLETEGFQFFDNDVVRLALTDYIHSSAGFVDCLINRLNKTRVSGTLTFDKKAAGLKGMKLLDLE